MLIVSLILIALCGLVTLALLKAASKADDDLENIKEEK